jgi:hypothetical protein
MDALGAVGQRLGELHQLPQLRLGNVGTRASQLQAHPHLEAEAASTLAGVGLALVAREGDWWGCHRLIRTPPDLKAFHQGRTEEAAHRPTTGLS